MAPAGRPGGRGGQHAGAREHRDHRRREQLRHDVVAVVRDQILSGRARPGDILRLGPIAEEMDVSITPVREALLMLAQDGWIAQEPNRGFRILAIRRRDVEDVYLMWGDAEGEIAARAVPLLAAADMRALRDLDARLRATEGPDQGELALQLNTRFHDYLNRVAEAPKLRWFADAARRLVPYELWSNITEVPGWRDFNRTGHTVIVDALVAGDPDRVRAEVRRHFVVIGELVLSWLDSIAFWSPEAPGVETESYDSSGG